MSRVLAARQRIAYRPVPYERVVDPPFEQPRDWWHWMSLLLVLLAVVVVSALLLTPDGNRDAPHVLRASYQYQYAVAPPFLSDGMAISAALVTLTSSGLDQGWWTPVQATNRNDNLAPDGSLDAYLVRTPPGDPNAGVVIFESERGGEPDQIVRLQLQGSRLTARIAPAR